MKSLAGLPSLRVRRKALIVYGLVLTLATHWPSLAIQGPISRPDLYAHFIAFSLLMVFVIGAELFGPLLSKHNLLISFVLGIVWAGVDELTQGIPVLHRHVTFEDFLANLGGLVLGVLIWVLGRRLTRIWGNQARNGR